MKVHGWEIKDLVITWWTRLEPGWNLFFPIRYKANGGTYWTLIIDETRRAYACTVFAINIIHYPRFRRVLSIIPCVRYIYYIHYGCIIIYDACCFRLLYILHRREEKKEEENENRGYFQREIIVCTYALKIFTRSYSF